MTMKFKVLPAILCFAFIAATATSTLTSAWSAETNTAEIRALTRTHLPPLTLHPSETLSTAKPRDPPPRPTDPADARPDLPPLTLRPSGSLTVSKLMELTHRATGLALDAIGMIGINYKRGGSTPENGLDCSGLVHYIFMQSWGTVLPRTSADISKVGQKVKTKDLQPGDLVFYNTIRRGFSHVGIYIGNNLFIHAPSSGGQVRIDSMDLAYWKKRFNGARRIDDPEQKISPSMLGGQ